MNTNDDVSTTLFFFFFFYLFLGFICSWAGPFCPSLISASPHLARQHDDALQSLVYLRCVHLYLVVFSTSSGMVCSIFYFVYLWCPHFCLHYWPSQIYLAFIFNGFILVQLNWWRIALISIIKVTLYVAPSVCLFELPRVSRSWRGFMTLSSFFMIRSYNN